MGMPKESTLEIKFIYLYVALFTALIIVGSYIRIPMIVPITLQSLFIYIATLSIGWYAALSVVGYLLLGIVGLPIFARGGAGIAYLAGPTGGFLIGFLVLAAFIALFRRPSRSYVWNAIVLAIGTIILYAIGAVWLQAATEYSFSKTISVAVLPFLVGDAIKIIVSVGLYRVIEKFIKELAR